jgi:hypothetical protein
VSTTPRRPYNRKAASNIRWAPVIDRGIEVVAQYDTLVTLRQLFYRLVAEGLIPNTTNAYKVLSNLTAEARREGTFPELTDRTRGIDVPQSFGGPDEATDWLQRIYRRDRTENQDVSIFLGVEKATMVAQLHAWFGDERGIPVVALGGYASQSLADDVRREVERQGRPAVLLYAGDFDPSGEDIDRDFAERTGCWDKVIRVALDDGQVQRFGLPPAPGKATDSRAASFEARHGELVQVELESLAPEDLRQLYADELADYWDEDAYQAVLDAEAEDLELL